MWKDNFVVKISTKILSIPYPKFILACVILSFILDFFNLIFFQQIGLELLIDSALFTKALNEAAFAQGVILDPTMENDIKSLYYQTLLFICASFVVLNILFYVAAARLKKWGIDYIYSMNALGALLCLTMIYEIAGHSLFWFIQMIFQTIAYIILSYFMFKRRKENKKI